MTLNFDFVAFELASFGQKITNRTPHPWRVIA